MAELFYILFPVPLQRKIMKKKEEKKGRDVLNIPSATHQSPARNDGGNKATFSRNSSSAWRQTRAVARSASCTRLGNKA